MSSAEKRSPAGAVGYRSVGTLLSAAGGWALSGGLLGPGKRRRRPSRAGTARGCQPAPRRYRPHTEAAAAVHAICRGQLTPSLFCEGEREREQSLREGGRGSALAPLCDAAESREGRRGAATSERHRLSLAAATAALGHSLGTEGKERQGKPGSCLALPRVSYSFPPTTPGLLFQTGGPCGEGVGACRGSRRLLGASPLPGHACPSPAGETPAPRPPRPAAFPLRFYNDFLPEKINLFARQVRSDQQAVVYYVFIFLSSPPALYRLTVDLTFGISAHTQQLNGNKLSTFTSDKHYP